MKTEISAFESVAGAVSRETFERIVAFEPLFHKWARRINLTASSTLDDAWSRHILDSVQLMPLAPEARHWLDLGSGAGFPGLMVAFMLGDRAGGYIELIESNHKKVGFLQAVIGQFSLPAKVHVRRIEDAPPVGSRTEIVTARALAPLTQLLDLSAPWLSCGATGLFHKGRDYRAEVQESLRGWTFDLVEHPSKIDPHGVILEISNLSRRPISKAVDHF